MRSVVRAGTPVTLRRGRVVSRAEGVGVAAAVGPVSGAGAAVGPGPVSAPGGGAGGGPVVSTSSDQPPASTPVVPAVPSLSTTKRFHVPFGFVPANCPRPPVGSAGAGATKLSAKPGSMGEKTRS